VNLLRFPGQYEDNETGLHYNYYRYYNPEIGKYLRIDPLRISELKIIFQLFVNKLLKNYPINFIYNSENLIFFSALLQYGNLNPQIQNVFTYVKNNPVNWVDPYGLTGNPFPKLPSFVDAFPNSIFVAPVADIIVGGVEAGVSVAAGVAAGVSFIIGPEFWWITLPTAPLSLEAGWDAYSRISGAMEKLGEGSPCP
jgi:RHS repeat-associated protein